MVKKKTVKVRKVGIIGSVCNKLDGQTIKTKILYDELRKNTNWDFFIANTQDKTNNPIRLLINSLYLVMTCRDVFLLVSQNGARVYFPMLYYASKIFKTRVYHDVIGGSPEDYVINDPKNRKYLNSFTVNWVETKQMCYSLQDVGVYNSEPLPNFKRLQIVSNKENEKTFVEPIPMCTFSRVMKEKGIEDAINAVEAINTKHNKQIIKLDIYGNIDDNYKARFEEVLSRSSDAISYKGTVAYDKSVDVVKEYYALLFPTYWSGEGFPGTIIDAFSAGVPVIATDWSSNGDIILDGYNGFIYPNNLANTLEEALLWAINNPEEMHKMRDNCIIEATKYQPEEHINTIISKVEEHK